MEESGELALQYHNGLGKWLPWCTIAQIESLTRMEEKYGDMGGSKGRTDLPQGKAKWCEYQSCWLGADISDEVTTASIGGE